jgi:hypothetical protein
MVNVEFDHELGLAAGGLFACSPSCCKLELLGGQRSLGNGTRSRD